MDIWLLCISMSNPSNEITEFAIMLQFGKYNSNAVNVVKPFDIVCTSHVTCLYENINGPPKIIIIKQHRNPY